MYFSLILIVTLPFFLYSLWNCMYFADALTYVSAFEEPWLPHSSEEECDDHVSFAEDPSNPWISQWFSRGGTVLNSDGGYGEKSSARAGSRKYCLRALRRLESDAVADRNFDKIDPSAFVYSNNSQSKNTEGWMIKKAVPLLDFIGPSIRSSNIYMYLYISFLIASAGNFLVYGGKIGGVSLLKSDQ